VKNLFHIALVEDEAAERILLSGYLEQAGFQVSQAEGVASFKELLAQDDFDLVLLDLNLPDGDGLALAHWLRKHRNLPIIMVTSRDRLDDRVAGLEQGASDYLCKPFHPRELLLRIENVRQQHKNAPDSGKKSFRIGRFTLDMDLFTFTCRSGKPPHLTNGEMKLLGRLAVARGRPVARGALIDAVSEREDPASDRTVDVLISRLRHKIEENPETPQLILTVPGVGYRLHG
jgi:DNA-binding response OmpR family regulator